MDTKEIVRCALQIERANADRSYGNLPTLLADLDKAHVTAELLEATDVVKVLYGLLRTCSDGGVKKTAKSLLSKWKRQYRTDPELSREVSPAASDNAGDISKHRDSNCGSEETCDGKVKSVKSAEEQEEAKQSGIESCNFSSVRSKCVQLLLAALCPELLDRERFAELAADIERHIHGRHKASQLKYKACVRSKVANLRNPKSNHLCQGILSGSLCPEAFARMSAEEMAGTELRQLREEYSSQGVSERQLPRAVEGTHTQKVRCKRCGGTDCSVTQVSRGALFLPAWVRSSGPDEDAMTFVTCGGCGQQWYHSGWVCL